MVGEHGGDVADRTTWNSLLQDVIVGQEPAPHAFEQEQASGVCEIDEVAGLGGVAGECLFHQDGLACLQGEPGLAVVLGVR